MPGQGQFREGAGCGRRAGQGTLTAFLAVLHTVAVQASSSLALRGPPLEGHSGVGNILHRQMGGLAGGPCAEGRSERGLSYMEGLPLWLAFRHFQN